jgi:hypothetical protein
MIEPKAIRELNGYELVNLADLGDTGVNAYNGKAGYYMLETIRDCIADAIDNGELVSDYCEANTEQRITEIADSAVPIYTVDIFEALVELRAWGEDISDISDISRTNLCDSAMVCLYLVGERLARSLTEIYAPARVEA